MIKRRLNGVFDSRILLIVMVMTASFLAVQSDCEARTFMCNSITDYFAKRCTIHPYAVSRIVDGQIRKGHLVGCQFRSYTCMDGVCRDNYGAAQIPFDFPMDHLEKFCAQLCNNPSCTDPNGWK